MKELPDKAHYRPGEVATYFDVSISVIYQWIAEGKINALKVAGMRCLRISREEVEKNAIKNTFHPVCPVLAKFV